jgi:hypothetical protein
MIGTVFRMPAASNPGVQCPGETRDQRAMEAREAEESSISVFILLSGIEDYYALIAAWHLKNFLYFLLAG